jgi:hypothetical protein
MLGGLTLLAVRYLRIRKAGGCTTEQVLLFASAGVLLIILTSKVFSPQYLLWLLVLYSLMLRSPQLVTTRAETALLVATLLTHVIFPYLYSQVVANALPALLILTARDLVLVYLFVDLLSKVNSVSRSQSTIRPQLMA